MDSSRGVARSDGVGSLCDVGSQPTLSGTFLLRYKSTFFFSIPVVYIVSMFAKISCQKWLTVLKEH